MRLMLYIPALYTLFCTCRWLNIAHILFVSNVANHSVASFKQWFVNSSNAWLHDRLLQNLFMYARHKYFKASLKLFRIFYIKKERNRTFGFWNNLHYNRCIILKRDKIWTLFLSFYYKDTSTKLFHLANGL